MTARSVMKPAESIRKGDAIVFLSGEHRVSEILPYGGPLADIVFATARAADGWVISLERGASYEVAP